MILTAVRSGVSSIKITAAKEQVLLKATLQYPKLMTMLIIKQKLVAEILNSLEQELKNTLQAANNAHLAATDDQSVAETQYDTLAIEAGYLAEGQTRRVQEIRQAIKHFEALPLVIFSKEQAIALGSFVQIEKDEPMQHWFFIGPAAGGFRTKINKQHFTVITPQSPMGLALINKVIDDEVSMSLGANTLIDYISKSC